MRERVQVPRKPSHSYKMKMSMSTWYHDTYTEEWKSNEFLQKKRSCILTFITVLTCLKLIKRLLDVLFFEEQKLKKLFKGFAQTLRKVKKAGISACTKRSWKLIFYLESSSHASWCQVNISTFISLSDDVLPECLNSSSHSSIFRVENDEIEPTKQNSLGSS